MADQYMTVKDVADLLTVDEKTVRRYIKSRDLRALSFGARYRILASDVDAFLERRLNRDFADARDSESRFDAS